MRTKLFSMNWLALGFALLLVFQSCTIYRKATVTADEAIEANTRVKITRPNGQEYKFKRINREDGALVGYVKKDSKTATDLATLVIPEAQDQKFHKIDLDKLPDKEFHTKNKTMSLVVPVATLVVIAVTLMAVLDFKGDGPPPSGDPLFRI